MDAEAFLARAERYHAAGWRLAVVNATSILPAEGLEEGAFEVSWSFAHGTAFEHIHERVLPGEQVPSISRLFGGAFLYENEMRELFGIDVVGIDVDLKGELYKTATRVPFSPNAIRTRLEAIGRGAPPKHAAARPPAAVGSPAAARPPAALRPAVAGTAAGPAAVTPPPTGAATESEA